MRRLPAALVFALCATSAPSGRAQQDAVPPQVSDDRTDFQEQEPEAAPPVGELLDEAMRKLARSRNDEALKLMEQKDYPGALELLKQAFELDENNAQISNNLGYIYYLLGNREEAEKYYRGALQLEPERSITYLNLSDLLSDEQALESQLREAARLLERAREIRGNQPKVMLRQARIASRLGDFEDAMRFYAEYTDKRKPTNELCLELGDFYRDIGKRGKALEWYRVIEDKGRLGKVAAARIWDIEVEKQARKFGWARSPEVISGQAHVIANRGRIALNQGNLEEARRLLEEAVKISPPFSMARADLGEVLQREGRVARAELEYLRALALDNANPEIWARIGRLYLEQADNGRAAEAAIFLSRAVELRPDWGELHIDLAKALRAAGDLRGALAHVERYLAQTPSGEKHKTATLLKETIEQGLPRSDRKKSDDWDSLIRGSAGREPSEVLLRTLGRVRLHLSQGKPEAAMAELRRLPPKERSPEVYNLEARILYTSGKLREAAKRFEQSVKKDPTQGAVHEQLGVIYSELGEEGPALAHLAEAEKVGNAAAVYHRARLEMGRLEEGPLGWISDASRLWKLMKARRSLDTFLAMGSTSIYLKDAQLLFDKLTIRIYQLLSALAAALLLVVGLVAAGSLRLWGGADLATLISKHPDSGPDVQRVLSAIRHEVLKHNTMVLSGLVEAIERGDEDQSEKARYFYTSLVGDGKGEALADRLRAYAKELRNIGRSYGVRLNLRRKDAAISALLAGFDRLESAAPMLRRVMILSESEKNRLLRSLKSAFHLLNTRGYEAVRSLLDRLRVLTVDEALLRAVFDKVKREPGLADVDLAPVALEESVPLPVKILISRQAFEDVMINLYRNAVQSSMQLRERPVKVGVRVADDVDPITGFESAVFLVLDRSPKTLTTEMIRGRYIEEGLGLTAEIVSKYEGTMDVLPMENETWSKAVRVKLPAVWGEDEGTGA